MTPAAAVKEGCSVELRKGFTITVTRVHSSTPHPGIITWNTRLHGDVEIQASELVQVLSWPAWKDPMKA